VGRSDLHLYYNLYFPHIKTKPKGEVALLGFTNQDYFFGDLYDLQLGNWDINSEWSLPKKYDTIICTRCAYFAKDPKDFIKRCYDNLKEGGTLYVDWALGDHWRFENYKIGWVKDGEHEYSYGRNNFLWSTVWDDEFLENAEFKIFCERVEKFGYSDIKNAIFQEVPKVLNLDYIKQHFNIEYNMLTLWDDLPQLYILLKGKK
jgi:SAM-dependent methyltransferase